MKNSAINYEAIDLSSPQEIETYAHTLPGMTFQEVLDLGIVPEGVSRSYDNKKYKGRMGTLIEERFFGYKANSNQEADFNKAGVELKVTCYDVKKNGEISAGERLVLTMIPFNRPIEDSFYDSHAWEKSQKILLIYYERNKNIATYDQQIKYACLFTPPEEDLKIIEDDYKTITSYIKAGKAEELSESLTSYLGACTKGASEATMWVEQYYPPHTKAKKRAFCFKRQYMDYVLHYYVMGQATKAERIVNSVEDLETVTFEDFVLTKINQYVGKTDKELCQLLGLKYTGNKAQWSQITYSILGIKGDKAEEFEKANVSVRTVRIEENGKIKESLSLNTIKFEDLIKEDWENAWLHNYFEETRFLFVSFQKTKDGYVLRGAKFWAMPQSDIEGSLKSCWSETINTIKNGVEFDVVQQGKKTIVYNNLPGQSDNPVAHVRPHTSMRYYELKDGKIIGENPSYGDVLPNGEVMTKQSFWLNNNYIYSIVSTE